MQRGERENGKPQDSMIKSFFLLPFDINCRLLLDEKRFSITLALRAVLISLGMVRDPSSRQFNSRVHVRNF
jgi:hypothetical protein